MKGQRNPDLFPYKIQSIKNFHYRNHPNNLHPRSSKYKKYWNKFLEYSLEGKWVYDEDTWVFMMPKLFFYANYLKVSNYMRDFIFPDIRDNEWIIASYILCVDGFSGFEDDEEYTCHATIEKYEKSQDKSNPKRDKYKLNFVEVKNLPESVKKKDGTYKKYVNAWYYLTRHYLIDNKKPKPLGRPLYENTRYNACILSARGVGKSYFSFVADFLHELMFSGVKLYENRHKINKGLLFGMGSARKPQLQRSINNARKAYYNMPGSYRFKNGKRTNGPFFKLLQGSWVVGSELNHIVKYKNKDLARDGSSIQSVVLTKDRTTVGAGDRFRRAYIEEFGFLENAIDVHGANKDSLRSEGYVVGSAFYTGTGGDMETIKQPKEMFTNPGAYDIFGIPNYWSAPHKKCGLFIPKTYALRDYKDENGNTYMEMAYNAVKEKREENKVEMDSISYELDIMFNPLNPEEMLRPGNNSMLPKQEAQNQLNKINNYDLFKKKAQVGKLSWDVTSERGVEWKKDLIGSLIPITDTKFDDAINTGRKDGAVIIYEQPPGYIPPNLYWIVYDPAAKSGDGESYHSVLVYKHFYTGSETTMYDTIVAEWIGRKETLDDNYQEVIKMAKYFNARIFPEVNVAGFVEYCKRKNHGNLLEGDAYHLEQEIHGKSAIARSYYKVGFQMNKRKKNWCLKKIRDWLLEVKEVDAVTQAPIIRTMDWIFSPRILTEIIEYSDDPNENFDHVSSLLGLMLLLGKIDGIEPADVDDEEKHEFESTLIPQIETGDGSQYQYAQRCEFLNY